MRTFLTGLLLVLAAHTASAATILCVDCGDPKVDFRNYGAAAYNMAFGADSDNYNNATFHWSGGLSSPIIVANPVANTHAEVMIYRDFQIETAFTFPIVVMDRYWTIVVQAPDGTNHEYQILVGTNQLFVDPVAPAEVENHEQDPQQDTGAQERAGEFGGGGGGGFSTGAIYQWVFYPPWGVFPGNGSYGSPVVTIFEMRRFSE